jgi:hypothetical protein
MERIRVHKPRPRRRDEETPMTPSVGDSVQHRRLLLELEDLINDIDDALRSTRKEV